MSDGDKVEFPGFGEVTIPDRIPADLAPPLQFFPLKDTEFKISGFIWFLVMRFVVQRPPGASRTIGGLYKICCSMSRSIAVLQYTDSARAQGLVLGVIRAMEDRGLIRCEPSFKDETLVSPTLSATVVAPAGPLLNPDITGFMTKYLWFAVCWGMRDQLSAELDSQMFPPPKRPGG